MRSVVLAFLAALAVVENLAARYGQSCEHLSGRLRDGLKIVRYRWVPVPYKV